MKSRFWSYSYSSFYSLLPSHRGLGEECTTLYILSEGRKIESRRQLIKIFERIGNETEERHAREQPLPRERARKQKQT